MTLLKSTLLKFLSVYKYEKQDEDATITTFPGSPRLLKDAIIRLDPVSSQASTIEFQYNPETMTCGLEARTMGGTEGGDKSEAFRLTGIPKETITLIIEFNAADQTSSMASASPRAAVPRFRIPQEPR